jgi:hypothetical protein
MSITQFKNTATLQLDESSPVAVPLGEPVAIASTTSVERDDGVETGRLGMHARALAPADHRAGILSFHFRALHVHPGRWRRDPAHTRRRCTDVASQHARNLGYPGNRAQELRADFLIV